MTCLQADRCSSDRGTLRGCDESVRMARSNVDVAASKMTPSQVAEPVRVYYVPRAGYTTV